MSYYARGYRRGGGKRVAAGYIAKSDLSPAQITALAYDHYIVRDIAARVERWGSISPKQMALVEKLAGEGAAREATFAARAAKLAAAGVAIPTGKVEVEGAVTTLKWKDGAFPGYKMIVEHDSGWRCWLTVPAAFKGADGEPTIAVGDRVRLTATVKRSDDDPAFGFGSRPSKATVLPTPARAVAALVAELGAFSRRATERAARRERDAAGAVAGAVAAMGRWWARDALAVGGAVAAMGAFSRRVARATCDYGKCYGGWIRHFSTDYPCATCEACAKRAAKWSALFNARRLEVAA
jgi:hypothetical protein